MEWKEEKKVWTGRTNWGAFWVASARGLEERRGLGRRCAGQLSPSQRAGSASAKGRCCRRVRCASPRSSLRARREKGAFPRRIQASDLSFLLQNGEVGALSAAAACFVRRSPATMHGTVTTTASAAVIATSSTSTDHKHEHKRLAAGGGCDAAGGRRRRRPGRALGVMAAGASKGAQHPGGRQWRSS